MATTKECNHCNKTYSTSEFYKKSASKDGLQPKCKSCVKEINTNFRLEKPTYQLDWQKKNHSKWYQYLTKWVDTNIKADDSRSAIYMVVNPEQKVYVGMTQTKFSARKNDHKSQFKLTPRRRTPLLHDSFSLYGFDTHKWYVFDMPGTDRESLKRMESNLIQKIQKQGMSLNIRVK